MTRRDFRAAVPGGELIGWVQGSGSRVLLLNGGPGLSFAHFPWYEVPGSARSALERLVSGS